jgi:hypothetical protein
MFTYIYITKNDLFDHCAKEQSNDQIDHLYRFRRHRIAVRQWLRKEKQ